MSTVKALNFQAGQSVTATNNFTIYQPASPDGTVRWGVGNSGSVTDIVTLNSSGYVGVGTTSPSYKLDVSSSAFTVGRFSRSTAGASASIDIVEGSGGYVRLACNGGTNNMSFRPAGNELMLLDSTGNLGLGVTPSAWGSGFRAFEVGKVGSGLFSVGATSMQVTNNYYYNGSNYIYAANGAATRYHLFDGQHAWYTAPSGTAGNAITFTQAMTLDASGNLGIGTSSPQSNLEVVSGTNGVNNGVRIRSTASGATGNWNINISGSNSLGFYDVTASSSPRAVIDSSGNVGIGTSSPNSKLAIGGSSDISFVSDGQGISWGNANNGSPRIYGSAAVSTGYLAFKGAGGSEAVRIDYSNNLQFNSGYGSVATAYGCRAWVNFNGTGTVAIRGSANVSSITDVGVGNYAVNFTNAMPDDKYSCTSNAVKGGGLASQSNSVGIFYREDRVLTGSIEMFAMSYTGTLVDPTYVMCTVIR